MSTLTVRVSSTLLALALASVACNNNPTAGKTQAKTSEAVTPAPAAAPSENTQTIPLTKASGKVGFVGAKVTDKHEGSFADYSGSITLVDGAVEKSSVKVTIDIKSLEIEPDKLKGHLLSPDLFDSEKFPTSEFASTKIAPADGGKYEVTGNLTLHGVTKSISFPAEIAVSPSAVTVKAEFGINRKDFGIVYPGMPDDLIKDDVLIQLDLKADRS